jgi:2-(1,2-epoxy-1,2-dihydrophenyl)acetyl-CoA isomerase
MSTTSSRGVELSVDGGIADLRIAGPIDMEWASGLRAHAAALAARDDVRVVRLTAEGRFFCPGGDLQWMLAQPDRRTAVHELAVVLHEGMSQLMRLDAPVVARVHGTAAGAGMSLVLAADIAIAGAAATFTMAYTRVGLSPDGGSSWLLPRIVGRRRAAEIMLLNPRIDADEAERLGIVTRTVPDDELDSAVDAVVAQLAEGPTPAFGAVKRLLGRSSQVDLDDQLHAEAESVAELGGSATGREGITAFVEKRRPEF